MSHSSVCEDAAGGGVAQIHEWMFRSEENSQRISPAQGVGSNDHCVGIISIGTQFMDVALFLQAGYLNQVC